ncbi:hypothetical protein ALC57_08788 [Trachymyrmex cornetzi]|uniref:Uncharacterized protein n=1 Tax=Trachymyrmex cornetzi TaxID=471704 RepID=A0A151J6N0_9HYME|nr:hypothetical protein ALC57_08788 [Trachymyrmex cornetzi]
MSSVVQNVVIPQTGNRRFKLRRSSSRKCKSRLCQRCKALKQSKKAKTDLQLILVAPQEEQDKVEKFPTEDVKKLDETKAATQTEVMVLPTGSSDVTQIYILVKIDKQGQIQLLDNNGPFGRNYTESGQHENLT